MNFIANTVGQEVGSQVVAGLERYVSAPAGAGRVLAGVDRGREESGGVVLNAAEEREPLVMTPIGDESVVPRAWTVQSGDSLYAIAERELGDGNLWPALARANGISLENADLIRPGQQLVIPGEGNVDLALVQGDLGAYAALNPVVQAQDGDRLVVSTDGNAELELVEKQAILESRRRYSAELDADNAAQYEKPEANGWVYLGAGMHGFGTGVYSVFDATGTFIGEELGAWNYHGFKETKAGQLINSGMNYVSDTENGLGRDVANMVEFSGYLADNLTEVDYVGYWEEKAKSTWSNITSYFSDTDSVEIVHDVSNAGGKLAGDALLGGGAVRVIRSGSKLVSNRTRYLDSTTDSGSIVHHGKHSTAIGSDDVTLGNFKQATNTGNGHNVIVHGSRPDYDAQGGVFVVDRNPTNSQQIVDALVSNPNYKSGSPVCLGSCWSGSNGTAQEVATGLNATVIAPTRPVRFNQSTGQWEQMSDAMMMRRHPDLINIKPEMRTFNPENN
ncbi:MAG: LysM peptidoglycan-binding domain-containing protein [Sedimenticola sp.]